MRKFTETTARNLLRRPLVLGVPSFALVILASVTLAVFVLSNGHFWGDIAALCIGTIGYGILRVASRWLKAGWEESFIFWIERKKKPQLAGGLLHSSPSPIEAHSPDTLTSEDLLTLKQSIEERMGALKPGERIVLSARYDTQGVKLTEHKVEGQFDLSIELDQLTRSFTTGFKHAYSLYQLPVSTDPLWLSGVIHKAVGDLILIASFQGVDQRMIKRRIELSRRSNSQQGEVLSNIDSEVSFEESSLVLQGISRGTESIVEGSVVLISSEPLELDDAVFCKERNPKLAVLSALGIRPRLHRSHLMRACTASDLIPNILDPAEDGLSILSSLRGNQLYFSPQDPRLEALHWLVVGASGSGKSFFTGLVLKRMIDQGCPMSVLFVDHNRSFRRIVRSKGEPYLEPRSVAELEAGVAGLFNHWREPGTLSGIELSDLDLTDKKAAIHSLLSRVETFLRYRDTTHPLYLVLDECWNFMRDEPVLVQRAFREFRKLNGAVIAITQSLHDFLTDESGQSIFQNAPIRILLRQGEDVSRHQGVLGLNPVELARVSRLKQERGVYSECLVKTPFLSRVGRLYPTEEEHALLRTDNLRAELIAQSKKDVNQGAIECTVASLH